ncbi:terminase small subunit [Synechococcus phage S-B68]|nr:terminase small subunit [Synechococcus phage S-B68]
MTTPFESLDDAFNTAPTEEVVSAEIVPLEDAKPVKKSKVEPADKVEDREKDYQYARGQLYDVVEKMQEILNGAMEVAAQSDHPRAYEVAFNGAKHVADAVEKLQDLHKKEKALSQEDVPSSGGGVNHGTVNNVFMAGTTNDLLKMLKETQKEDK